MCDMLLIYTVISIDIPNHLLGEAPVRQHIKYNFVGPSSYLLNSGQFFLAEGIYVMKIRFLHFK